LNKPISHNRDCKRVSPGEVAEGIIKRRRHCTGKLARLDDIEYQLLTAVELKELLKDRRVDLYFKRRIHPDTFQPMVTFRWEGKDYVMPLERISEL
jgi:hypothetical protein